jgi:hypothetical protein
MTVKEKDNNALQASKEVVQRFYAVFLPPDLRLEAQSESRGKRRKIKNRKHVYTGDSRTSNWRKETARKLAAEGCAVLDPFLTRKVCP